MAKKLPIILLLIFSNIYVFGQADCKIFYIYKASIITDSVVIYKISLPTTPFLAGYISKYEARAFYTSTFKGPLINDTLITHLSSDFCGQTDSIITRFFKRDKKEYIIKIIYSTKNNPAKHKTRFVSIPIEFIRFFSDNLGNRSLIIIDFGEIRI